MKSLIFLFLSVSAFADSIPLKKPGVFNAIESNRGRTERTTTIEVPDICYSRDPYCTSVIDACSSTQYICKKTQTISLGYDYYEDMGSVEVKVLPAPAGYELQGSLIVGMGDMGMNYHVTDSSDLLYEIKETESHRSYSGRSYRFITSEKVEVRPYILADVKASMKITDLTLTGRILSFESPVVGTLKTSVKLQILKKVLFGKRTEFSRMVTDGLTVQGSKVSIDLDALDVKLGRGNYTFIVSKSMFYKPEITYSPSFEMLEEEVSLQAKL